MIDGSVLQSAQKCFEKKSRVVVKMVVIFLKLSSASDWIICTKECELIKSGHTFGLLAVNSYKHTTYSGWHYFRYVITTDNSFF